MNDVSGKIWQKRQYLGEFFKNDPDYSRYPKPCFFSKMPDKYLSFFPFFEIILLSSSFHFESNTIFFLIWNCTDPIHRKKSCVSFATIYDSHVISTRYRSFRFNIALKYAPKPLFFQVYETRKKAVASSLSGKIRTTRERHLALHESDFKTQ